MFHPKDDELGVLIFLPWEDARRHRYEQLILAALPHLKVHSAKTLKEASELIRKAEVFMAFGAAIQEDIFKNAPRLRWVHALGTGLDGITDQPGLAPEVLVTATRDIHGAPLSEIAILFMLALARNFRRSILSQQRHEWDRFHCQLLHGKTVAIIGVGKIAEDLAPRLCALGMTVVGVTRSPRKVSGFDRMERREDIHSVVAGCDWVVLLAPLDSDTRRMIDAAVFKAMKSTAFLVNIARGGLIDEDALLSALIREEIAGAALDTTDIEPLPAESPLWNAPNLIITPHVGGFHEGYVDESFKQMLHNLKCYAAGDFVRMSHRELR